MWLRVSILYRGHVSLTRPDAMRVSFLHVSFGSVVVLSSLLLLRFLLLHESLPTNGPVVADRVDSSLHKLLRSQRRVEERLERLANSLQSLQLSERQREDAQLAREAEAEQTDDQPLLDEASRAKHAMVVKESVGDEQCPGRSPYHTLLTSQGSPYQQWQSRIAYFHWQKQRKLDGPCTAMLGFHRLCATPGGKPDGLEAEIPTIFTVQLSDEVINAHFGFGVLNRPNSVKQLLATPAMRIQLVAPYVLLLETDHVFMRPLPNLATKTKPVAWDFGYMHAGPHQNAIIRKYWPEGDASKLDPVGPSPLLIHVDQLVEITPRWLDWSLGLRSSTDAEAVMQGWVQEMWGYSIAAASVGVKHNVMRDLQIEASSLTQRVDPKFTSENYIFHYTYGIEYTMDGRPQGVNQIGEWSLDKRHYGSDHPPRRLQPPPTAANAAAFWLLEAWNEASAGIATWPTSHSMGTIGWRRVKPTEEEVRSSVEASAVAGTRWAWGEDTRGIAFHADGRLVTPWDPKGSWGLIRSASEGADDGIARCVRCLFADFANANHNLRFNLDATPPTFVAIRVGDLARVEGKKLGAAAADAEQGEEVL